MTPTQAHVAAICARILGLDRIGLDENFFEVGSDSHLAVLVALEIESTFDVSLPLEIMEASADVRTLASWIDEQPARQATQFGAVSTPESACG